MVAQHFGNPVGSPFTIPGGTIFQNAPGGKKAVPGGQWALLSPVVIIGGKGPKGHQLARSPAGRAWVDVSKRFRIGGGLDDPKKGALVSGNPLSG